LFVFYGLTDAFEKMRRPRPSPAQQPFHKWKNFVNYQFFFLIFSILLLYKKYLDIGFEGIFLLETTFTRQKAIWWKNNLLFAGAKIDSKTCSGLTSLHLACESGHLGVVAKLLDHNRLIQFTLSLPIIKAWTHLLDMTIWNDMLMVHKPWTNF